MTPKYKTNLSPKNNSTETSPRSTKKAKVQLKVECLHLLVSKIKYRLQSDLCCEFRNSYAFRNWRISVRMIVAVPVLESNSQVQFDLTRILWRLLDLLSENCLFWNYKGGTKTRLAKGDRLKKRPTSRGFLDSRALKLDCFCCWLRYYWNLKYVLYKWNRIDHIREAWSEVILRNALVHKTDSLQGFILRIHSRTFTNNQRNTL
jgi:hypothetical protein